MLNAGLKYPLHQSPLYALKTKKKLALLLKVDQKDLRSLAADSNYKLKDREGRKIQDPKHKLKQVHKRAKQLLARIETPEWLMSGQRGKSIVSNANWHKDSKFLLNVDIEGFYRNTTKNSLVQVLIYDFKMNGDVAHLLADILTWNEIIPTGSPSSQLIAYWANRKTFEDISKVAVEHRLKFSAYVDDLTFSSEFKPIPKNIPHIVDNRLRKVGLNIKVEKTKFYDADDFKVVTGVGITRDNKLAIQNSKQNKVIRLLRERNNQATEGSLRSIFGNIVSYRQILPSFLSHSYSELKKAIFTKN